MFKRKSNFKLSKVCPYRMENLKQTFDSFSKSQLVFILISSIYRQRFTRISLTIQILKKNTNQFDKDNLSNRDVDYRKNVLNYTYIKLYTSCGGRL